MDSFLITRKAHLTNVRSFSLKYIEANGRGNDLKMASFLVFFKMSLFKFKALFMQGIMGKIKICRLIIIFRP